MSTQVFESNNGRLNLYHINDDGVCDYASNFYGNEEECAQEFNALVHQEMDPIEEGWESIADPQSVYEEECGNLIAEGNYANPDIYREGAGIAAERFFDCI